MPGAHPIQKQFHQSAHNVFHAASVLSYKILLTTYPNDFEKNIAFENPFFKIIFIAP